MVGTAGICSSKEAKKLFSFRTIFRFFHGTGQSGVLWSGSHRAYTVLTNGA